MLRKQCHWLGDGGIIHLMEAKTGKKKNKCHLVESSWLTMRNPSPEIGHLFPKGTWACPGAVGVRGHTSLHLYPLCWPGCAKAPLPKVSAVTPPGGGGEWSERKPGVTWHTLMSKRCFWSQLQFNFLRTKYGKVFAELMSLIEKQ